MPAVVLDRLRTWPRWSGQVEDGDGPSIRAAEVPKLLDSRPGRAAFPRSEPLRCDADLRRRLLDRIARALARPFEQCGVRERFYPSHPITLRRGRDVSWLTALG